MDGEPITQTEQPAHTVAGEASRPAGGLCTSRRKMRGLSETRIQTAKNINNQVKCSSHQKPHDGNSKIQNGPIKIIGAFTKFR